MFKHSLAAVALCAGLSACATSQDAYTQLNSHWVGQPVDNFILAYGPPQGFFVLGSGDGVFAYGEAASFQTPVVANSYGSWSGNAYNGSASGTTIVTGGNVIPLECNIQVVADQASHKIKQVTITHDTYGMWQLSRCYEVFK